jgi:Haemin-degrading HemS.ChuX domain
MKPFYLLIVLACCVYSCVEALPSSRPLTSGFAIRRHAPKLSASLREYLQECNSLGPVRFVVVGEGAILETVGSFDNLRFSETPKGLLATLSTDDPCFECHIRCFKIDHCQQVVVEKNGKTLKIMRFNGRAPSGDDGVVTTFLSAILHGSDPVGDKAFEDLQIKYGPVVGFTDCVF